MPHYVELFLWFALYSLVLGAVAAGMGAWIGSRLGATEEPEPQKREPTVIPARVEPPALLGPALLTPVARLSPAPGYYLSFEKTVQIGRPLPLLK